MRYDCWGRDCASVIQNREVSLIRRSGKYTFLWPTVWDRRWLSVQWRAVIERFHCNTVDVGILSKVDLDLGWHRTRH